MNSADKKIWCQVGRYGVYLALMFGLYFLLAFVLLPKSWSFGENGLIEWMQFGFLATLGASLVGMLCLYPAMRRVLALLLCCALIAMFRELDNIMDAGVPFFGWQVIFFLTVPLCLWQFREPRRLYRELMVFIPSPAMTLYLAAMMVILPLAQCIGDGEFLRAALGGSYLRSYKSLIEETLELYGYLLLLCGAAETFLLARNAEGLRQAADTAPVRPTVGE